ncbi:MAG: PocR ligand-binding domain-containing protein [Bacteroidota bacterium]
MANLLTTKELQELLKVDRTTIYRMLKDGRITGVRVGGQWRFSKDDIDALLGDPVRSDSEPDALPGDPLPIHCVFPIQQVFAEIAQVGSLTTAPDGEPLTEVSNCAAFCSLMLNSPSGKKACISSWHKLAQQSEKNPKFVSCHAGLQYARARIEINGDLVAMVIAGQFYEDPPDPAEEDARIEKLAALHEIPLEELRAAAKEIRQIDHRFEQQLGGWLQKVADTFEEVAHERLELMNRLRSISHMSTLPNR